MRVVTPPLPALAVAVVLALAPATARAHDIADPRVLVIVPGPERLEIRLNELEPRGGSGTELRDRFDEDRDGTLRDDERATLEAFLATRATRNLRVTQGGKPLALETVSRTLKGGDGQGAGPGSETLSIDVVLAAKPVGKRVEVSISDWRPDGHEVRGAVIAVDARIVSASQGTLDAKKPVVTGVALDRDRALLLVYERE